MSNLARLDGKLAIITGGGSGIGEATAKVFSEAGATVVVTGRRPEPLERVAKEIGGHAITCDVSDQAQVRKMFAQALQITGQIDILLNNAGVPGPIAPSPPTHRAFVSFLAGRIKWRGLEKSAPLGF